MFEIKLSRKEVEALDELLIMTAGEYNLGPDDDPVNKLVMKLHGLVSKELNKEVVLPIWSSNNTNASS